MGFIQPDSIIYGDSREVLRQIEPNSIACSLWSPPYHVGKEYEVDMTYMEWTGLLSETICHHYDILKSGAFLAINIADILCFKDENIPKIMAENISRKRVNVTKEQILEIMHENPGISRYQIAKKLGCSEQTIDRRLKGNNIRGGKYSTQTRVKLVGGLIEQMAIEAGLYLYDRRIWMKDPAWENSRWHSNSYRAVDEFEYVYIFWKPGATIIDRNRLTKEEWINWGSRGVWMIPSVRANDNHEAKFPLELPRRIIRLLTEPDDVVLDCFVGSGTTAVAAILEGRRYIGVDSQEKYAQMSMQAVEQTKQGLLVGQHPQLI
ncbi:MAG: DNA methyltransferase [bacterium]|nr:DNA methyltransferase [bacterium]